MKNLLVRFLTEESGQDIIEYALLLVIVALVIVGFATAIETEINEIFSETVSALQSS